MAASVSDVARLRRLIAEPTTDTYSDADLADAIERYPLPDADDNESGDLDWVASYDVHLAASDCWAEKAAAIVATAFDFDADDGSFKRSQLYDNYMTQARLYRNRRAIRSIVQRAAGPFRGTLGEPWIVNAAAEEIL